LRGLGTKTATPIAPLSVRWPLLSLAETVTSDHASAACYRASKHVRVHPIVVAELKFRDVQRHVFGGHLVERADHAALKDAPKALNRVRVNRADNVLISLVVNLLVRKLAKVIAVARPRVSRQQADLVGNGLIHEIKHGLRRNPLKHAGNYIAVALDRADDRGLVIKRAVLPLIPMPVLILAANPRLIHFHNAAKLLLRRDQTRADFVAHGMGRLVAAEAHHALNLEGAHSLLAGKHQMSDPVPVAEGLFGVLENGAYQGGKAIGTGFAAFHALPMKRLVGRGVVHVLIAAARAMHTFRPAPGNQIAKTSRVIPNWEAGLELGRSHLRYWFRALCHDVLSPNLSVGGYCHD
jgi:hypothetical protein